MKISSYLDFNLQAYQERVGLVKFLDEQGLLLMCSPSELDKVANYLLYAEDVDAEVEKMASMYGMKAEDLKNYMGDSEKESMKRDIAVKKAVEFVMANVKERAKAKSKTAEADAE